MDSVSCNSLAILVILVTCLIAGNTAVKADDLYIRCEPPATHTEQHAASSYCQVGKEVCSPKSGQCEPASTLQKLTNVAPWIQCHQALQQEQKDSLPDVCLHVLKSLEAQSDGHSVSEACDTEDKMTFRLVVIIFNCIIGIIFLIMTYCWFKGWICGRDGRPHKSKLSTDVRGETKIMRQSSTVQIRPGSVLSTISFQDNLKKSTNVSAANTAGLNDVIIKGLEKISHDSADKNVNSRYNC